MALSRFLVVLLCSLILCTQAMDSQSPLKRRRKRDTLASSMFSAFTNLEKSLAAVEAASQCDNSTLEAEMISLREKMSALDKRLDDINSNAASIHNASLMAIHEAVHSMTELAAASEQNFKSSMRSVMEIFASLMSSTESRLLAQIKSDAAVFNDSMASMELTTKELATRLSALENVTEQKAALEPAMFSMQNATEILAALINDTKVQLLTRAKDNADMFNISITRVEQTTKELTRQVSVIEDEVHFGRERMIASEQAIHTIQNTTEILGFMINDTTAQLLARAKDNIAMSNASFALVQQSTTELATRLSTLENKVHSGAERMAASDQSLKSSMQNDTENLALLMNDTKAQLLAKCENNTAVLNASITTVEHTTRELVTRVSAMEAKFDNCKSLHTEETTTVQAMLENLKNNTEKMCDCPKYRRTCQDYNLYDNKTSGVYRLHLQDGQGPMDVYCDMSHGAGWVVFQRRQDGSVNFSRNWTSYEDGFGDLHGEFWLGNRNIHRLTSAGLTQLRVDLQAWNGSTAFALYSHFSVDDASSSYNVSVSGYSGTAGDSLDHINGRQFSTYDQDHDSSTIYNCAQYHRGAWWHDSCTEANLNGEYGTRASSGADYVYWMHWLSVQSLQRTELKLQ